ncbi:hypothetical protein T492DRAFT_912220 [Pavlovales sp. CCMP2436]|nr:hypothetical protein T492DRAFT_912220 [Pavlovales sp. CCMP2436]
MCEIDWILLYKNRLNPPCVPSLKPPRASPLNPPCAYPLNPPCASPPRQDPRQPRPLLFKRSGRRRAARSQIERAAARRLGLLRLSAAGAARDPMEKGARG